MHSKKNKKKKRKSSQSAELRERFPCDDNALVPCKLEKTNWKPTKFPFPVSLKSFNEGVGISRSYGKERKRENSLNRRNIKESQKEKKNVKYKKNKNVKQGNDSVVHTFPGSYFNPYHILSTLQNSLRTAWLKL